MAALINLDVDLKKTNQREQSDQQPSALNSRFDEYYNTEQWMSEKISIIKRCLLEKYACKGYLILENKQNSSPNHFSRLLDLRLQQNLTIAGQSDKLQNSFSLYSKISIFKQIRQINVTSTILKNGQQVRPKSKPFSLLLARLFNKKNSNNLLCFKINPFSGEFYFSHSNVLTELQFREFIINISAMQNYIEAQLQACLECITYQSYRILELIQQLPANYFKLLSHKSKAFRPLHSISDINHLKFILKAVQCCQYQYEFMYNPVLRKDLTQIQIVHRIQQSRQKFDEKIITRNRNQQNQQSITVKYFNLTDKQLQQANDYKWTVAFFRKHELRLLKILAFSTSTASKNSYKREIFSQIMICESNQIKWSLLAEGGFSRIQKGWVIYKYVKPKLDNDPNTEYHAKWLVKKIDKSQYCKMLHQKAILEKIKHLEATQVSKFYETSQEVLDKYLFLDFYQDKSLQIYLNVHHETFSVFNKLWVLKQTAHALRFLRNNHIVHLDIKPENILIAKQLVLKLADFGEAFHPDVFIEGYRRGNTMPYAPPQIFSKLRFQEKIDVFSLGVMAHKILFGAFPYDVLNHQNKLIPLYNNHTSNQNILNSPEKTQQFGPCELRNLLYYLCIKCMNFEHDQRPTLEWIQLILCWSITYLQSKF